MKNLQTTYGWQLALILVGGVVGGLIGLSDTPRADESFLTSSLSRGNAGQISAPVNDYQWSWGKESGNSENKNERRRGGCH